MIPDAADVCRGLLDAAGVRACCEPVPEDLAGTVPLTVLSNGGGTVTDRVLCSLRVEAWTHDEDLAGAMAECARACEALASAEGSEVGGTWVYGVDVQQAPAEGYDPANPEVRLAGCVVVVRCRAV